MGGGNCFIRKSVNCPIMSAEAGNLCGLHSYKFSGIASNKALDVSVQNKKTTKQARPGARLQVTGLKKEGKKGAAQVSKALDAGFYRQDLAALAQTKYAKVKTSFKTKKITVKSRRAPKA